MSRGTLLSRRTLVPGVLVASLALVVACGDDEGDETSEASRGETSSTTATSLPACDEVGPLVVLSLMGVVTADGDEYNRWTDDPDYVMQVRPGAVELATAYHDAGYHLLYTTYGAADLDIHGSPYEEAVTGWLEDLGLPNGDRAQLLTGAADTVVVDHLLAWSAAGGSQYAAYTGLQIDVPPLLAGGVPRERLYTIEEAGDVDSTAVLADADLTAHLEDLDDPPPACRP